MEIIRLLKSVVPKVLSVDKENFGEKKIVKDYKNPEKGSLPN